MSWQIIERSPLAFELIEEFERGILDVTAQVAREASRTLVSETLRSFVEEVTPYYGEPWALAAKGTAARKGWRGLLKLSGQLIGDIRGDFKQTEFGAVASVGVLPGMSVKLANIHAYGIKGTSRSAKYRLRKSRLLDKGDVRAPKGGAVSMPARRFIGIAANEMERLVRFAEDKGRNLRIMGAG